MSVVEHHFHLLILNNQRVMLIPEKGEGRELPKREAEYAMRFLGIQSPVPMHTAKRIVELAKPLNDAPPRLIETQIRTLSVLGKNGDEMTVKAIAEQLRTHQGGVAGRLYKLEKLDLVNCIKPDESNPTRPHLWQITTQGIDTLAEVTKSDDN